MKRGAFCSVKRYEGSRDRHTGEFEKERMQLTFDYHTHTKYSDGKSTALENALAAKERGLKGIAITDHGFSHVIFGVKRKEKEQYFADIDEAGRQTGLPVLRGIEENILSLDGACELTEADFDDFDVYLVGFHPVVKYRDFSSFWEGGWEAFRYRAGIKPSERIFRETTRAFVLAIENNPIDILTHLNYHCFADVKEVAKCCRDYGTYLEISGKKTHFTDEELADAAATGVKFVVNSDAHSPGRIGDIALAEEQIRRVGVPLSQIHNIDGRVPRFRLAEYKRTH